MLLPSLKGRKCKTKTTGRYRKKVLSGSMQLHILPILKLIFSAESRVKFFFPNSLQSGNNKCQFYLDFT